jgi:hypothetical protein
LLKARGTISSLESERSLFKPCSYISASKVPVSVDRESASSPSPSLPSVPT